MDDEPCLTFLLFKVSREADSLRKEVFHRFPRIFSDFVKSYFGRCAPHAFEGRVFPRVFSCFFEIPTFQGAQLEAGENEAGCSATPVARRIAIYTVIQKVVIYPSWVYTL